jgi:hypothetical protein
MILAGWWQSSAGETVENAEFRMAEGGNAAEGTWGFQFWVSDFGLTDSDVGLKDLLKDRLKDELNDELNAGLNDESNAELKAGLNDWPNDELKDGTNVVPKDGLNDEPNDG